MIHRTLASGDVLVAYDARFVSGSIASKVFITLRHVLSSLKVECVLNLMPRWYDEILLMHEKPDDSRNIVLPTMLEEINWERTNEGDDVVTHELILRREAEVT